MSLNLICINLYYEIKLKVKLNINFFIQCKNYSNLIKLNTCLLQHVVELDPHKLMDMDQTYTQSSLDPKSIINFFFNAKLNI